jgi:dihydroanticapsin dehydrogenase
MNRLNGKVAIVTGAGAGIGKATAELFAEEGARLVVVDIDATALEETAANIKALGVDVLPIQADISDEDSVKDFVNKAADKFSRIDVLVNNAATFVLKGLEASVNDWKQSLHVNVIGTALCSKYAVAHMQETGGSIVIVSSVSGIVAQPSFITYSATKAALIQMTKNMSMDLAPFKIRVNCVCPFAIFTRASELHMKQTGMSLEAFVAEVGGGTLLKRVADPKEVAYPILFLASEESSFITGTQLVVDGGYTAQ